MKIAVMGTGHVGQVIADKLVALGHEVWMGSRVEGHPNALAWAAQHSPALAHQGTFAQAAQAAELVFNCTRGDGSLAALSSAAQALEGKIIVDLSNPLDFSQGMPPTLFVSGADSLAEQLQRALPQSKLVKTLNTVQAQLMVNPGLLGQQPHDMFLCGDDAQARDFVAQTVLRDWFGWQRVLDLGALHAARGLESYLPLWLRLWSALGTADFNLRVVTRA